MTFNIERDEIVFFNPTSTSIPVHFSEKIAVFTFRNYIPIQFCAIALACLSYRFIKYPGKIIR